MKIVKFHAAVPFQYNYAGKFIAPSSEWMHLTRQLSDFELFVVTEGVLYIASQESSYVVERGEFLLMPPTARQYGYRQGACTFYWLHFSPGGDYELLEAESMAEAAEKCGASVVLPISGVLRSAERMVVLMKQLQDSDRRYGMKALNDYAASLILAELSAQCLVEKRYEGVESSRQLYHDVVDYITLNSCLRLRVCDIADYFGYNEKYLTTCFKKWSRLSIKQFILQTKMENAKAQLSETNHSISQIGYNIGYSDPHNFANAFKKVTGLTPSEFRDSYSKRRVNTE